MTNQTQNAVSTPAIKKFEVGKTYVVEANEFCDCQRRTITIVKRTKCYAYFILDNREVEDDIFKRKINSLDDCSYEWLAFSDELEFNAKDVEVSDSNEVKADEVSEKFTTVKAKNATHAVEILDKLNFRNVEFVYHGETNAHGAPVVYRHFDGIKDGHDTCFGLIEIVINGKLDTVRFINNYREQFTDIKIGDAKYTVGDKGEINLIDEPETVNSETDSAEVAKFEVGKTYAAKKSVLFDSQINMTVINRTNCYVTFQFDDDEEDIRRCKIVDDAGVEKIYIHESNAIGGDYEFSANDVADETDDDEGSEDDNKLAELFQDREVKRRAALHSSFYSDESKAARDANKAVEEFIGKVAKDLRDKAPVGLSVVDSWDSADLDAPKFVVIELATDKRTCYSKIAQVKAALTVAKTVTVEAENVGNLTDSALAASNSRLTAFNTPEENVEKLFDAYEAQNSVAHISENGYIAAVNYQPKNDVHWHCKIRRYQNLDEAIDAVRYVNEHDTFTVTRGGRVETEYGKRNERTREYFARTLYGVEYFKEAYFDELVDQYAVTVDAFNFAVECEIEEAEIAAAESRAIARILADDNLAARYEKAKSQVKCERYENGYCGWYFKGKHSDDWEYDQTKAAACLTRYGLSRFEFSVLSEDETAVINSNGYDESAFDLLPTVDELNDVDTDEVTETVTDEVTEVAATVENKINDVDTLDTVDDQIETLEADEAVIEAIINVLTAQFDETFKQSEDADKAFNRAWLNCESSGVQSPLKSKSDTLHAALDRICDELQPLRQRKAALTSELVDLYGRHDDLAGVKIVNINGTFKRVDVAPANVADLPAVNAKIAELKRVTHSLADEISDAQRSLERKIEQGDDTNLEQIAAVIAAKNRRHRNLTDELLTLKAAKHGAFATLLDKRDELTKQRHKLDLIMRNGLITVDEFNCKLAELDSEIRYVEIQIDALNAGDTFDYVDAAEHIKGVYEDVKTCVDFWSREHGLTVEQCEKIYVAAHIDRNFTADVDRELINHMIDDFKRANDTTTVDSVNSEFDKAVAESVKDYSATVEINGETLTFEDGQLTEVASLRYGAYFKIRDGRRNFYYRGNRVSKQNFFGHIVVEDKAIAERAAIGEFVAKYGGSEFKPGTNPHGNFVAQIHPTLANGRQDNYEAVFDKLTDAHAFIDEFKTLAGDMKFIATIKRGSFYGEEIYRHGLNGQEFFAPVDEAEALNTKWKDAQRQLDKRITVEMQGGGTCAIDKDSDIRLTKIKDGYAFVDYGEIVAVGAKVVLGRYDTPAQVKEVIDKFGKSIFGNRFEFPHVEDVGKSDVEIAEELTAFLLKVTPLTAGFMDLTLQDGKETAASPRTATIEPDWHGNGRFAFVTPWNEVFARYDTASQVRTVIYRIKHAIEDKRDKFKYPTLAELTAPDYREKQWAVDFDIYHEDSDLDAAELEAYTDRLRDAMTANGNRACVELEDSLITIYGDNGGDNLTVQKIVREMCKRDCWVEYPEEEGDANEKARLC